MYTRNDIHRIMVRGVPIGGGSPVTVQSMTNTDTRNVRATVDQIRGLVSSGCEIVRLAVPDRAAADGLTEIRKQVNVPLVADIHFNYRLALAVLQNGVDKIRLNPGNIYRPQEVETVIKEAKRKKVPVRIGVNSGSLRRTGRNTGLLPQKMVNAVMGYVRLFEKLKFRDIVISMKTPDVRSTVESYRLLAKRVDYPFHLGIPAEVAEAVSFIGNRVMIKKRF